MTGLVRADTELMLLAAQEMQRASGVILEQFSSARQAMESLQSSAWSGRHRELMEERWLVLVTQFQPTATTLDDIALRMRRTAEALDGAALTFGDGAGGSSFLGNLGSVLKSLPLPVLLSWGLNPVGAMPLLGTVLMSPAGQKLLDAAKGIYDPALAAPITKLPDNGKAPVYVLVNGIGSEALPGQPDAAVLGMKEVLMANGVEEDHIITPGAAYNTNIATNFHDPEVGRTNSFIPTLKGTDFNGWLTPVDYLSSAGAWVANGITNGGAAMVDGVTHTANLGIGVAQTQQEYIMGENGLYTEQVLEDTIKDIKSNPLLEGNPVVLLGHSGGGAIVANMPGALEKEGIPVTDIWTMGSPVANYDFAKQYGHVHEIRDENDYIGTPAFRSNEGRLTLPLGLAGLALTANPLIPAGVLGSDRVLRNDDPNISHITTHNKPGREGTVGAHTGYWRDLAVYQAILGRQSIIMPNEECPTSTTSTKQGVTR